MLGGAGKRRGGTCIVYDRDSVFGSVLKEKLCSSSPSFSSLASCCWGNTSKMCLEHQPTLPAGIGQGKVQFLKWCFCSVTVDLQPLVLLWDTAFEKKKLKKKIQKLTPMPYFLFSLCCVPECIFEGKLGSVAVVPLLLLVLEQAQWKWGSLNPVENSRASSQLWALSRVLLVKLGCTFVPGELSGKLVLRHQQEPYARVNPECFPSGSAKSCTAANLQQV